MKRAAVAGLAGILFLLLVSYSADSSAEVNVNIGIGIPLPHVVMHAPPPVVLIPGTYAYFAPDAGVDIFFYHGYWYRPHKGNWYRANDYNGPWHGIHKPGVPHVLRDLPPDFRRKGRRNERIRYMDLKKNWRTWERKKHWDRQDNGRRGRDGRDRGKREDKARGHGEKRKFDR